MGQDFGESRHMTVVTQCCDEIQQFGEANHEKLDYNWTVQWDILKNERKGEYHPI